MQKNLAIVYCWNGHEYMIKEIRYWETVSESIEEELDKDFECGDYERECEPYYDDDDER